MFKKAAFTVVGLAMFFTPALALAQSVDLQSEIAALQAQIKALLAQIAQLQGQGSSQTNCVDISKNLTLGSSGSDVTNLQNYLIQRGLLDAQYNTGYYGFLTAQAVGKLQTNLGIVTSSNDTAYGITGPHTRKAIACNWPVPVPVTNGTLNAAPTSGAAPLSVNFWYGTTDTTKTYSISYGDGSTGSPTVGCAIDPRSGTGACPQGVVASHTYQTAGTYTATISQSGLPLCASCTAPILGAVTITVSGTTQSGSFTATPTSGTAPLAVQFRSSEGGAAVDFGDGTSADTLNPAPVCSSCTPVSVVSHTYQTAGMYTAKLLWHYPQIQACTSTNPNCNVLDTVTITVSDGSTQPPVSFSASPTSGQAPLGVSFSASYLSLTTNYTVNFGDGSTGQLNIAVPYCPAGSTNCLPSGSASHTYVSAGTYTATLTHVFTPACRQSNPPCGIASVLVTDGTVTITVSGTTQSGTLNAAPTSGAAPLTVNFWYATTDTTKTYSINYGDGSTGSPTVGCAINPASGTNACPQGVVSSHTYSSAGTYTATISQSGLPLCVSCTAPILGTVTITVSGGSTQSVSFSANPTSGAAPLSVSFNASGLGSVGGYTVNFGDGSSGSLLVSAPPCAYGTTCSLVGSASHTYASVGTYTATLKNSSGASLGTATVTVSATGVLSCTLSATPYGSGYGLTWTSQNAASAHLAPVPGFGSGWINVSTQNSDPSTYAATGSSSFTLTVIDSVGNQSTCSIPVPNMTQTVSPPGTQTVNVY